MDNFYFYINCVSSEDILSFKYIPGYIRICYLFWLSYVLEFVLPEYSQIFRTEEEGDNVENQQINLLAYAIKH